MHNLIFAVAFIGVGPIHVSAQNGWDDPFPAHQVMDNLYFVGTGGLGTYLNPTTSRTRAGRWESGSVTPSRVGSPNSFSFPGEIHGRQREMVRSSSRSIVTGTCMEASRAPETCSGM